ncbi:MAG: hypothetical protein P4L86_23800 [Mycobacterium sp.]|nr:hypothetical protein [Mycobacterium sp.]
MISPYGVPRVRDYVLFVKNSWVLVLVTTAVCAAVGWWSWHEAKPVYQSSASVFVRTEGSASPLDAYYGDSNMIGLMETYRQLATSAQVTSPIIQKLGLIESEKELAARILIFPGATALMTITVTGADADQTSQIAHEVANNMVAVSTRLAVVAGTGAGLAIVDDASPAQRVGGMWSFILTATVLGFALSVVAVLARALILGRVQSRRHLERLVSDACAAVPAGAQVGETP